MARDLDAELESARAPLREGERLRGREDGDTGAVAVSADVFGGGLGGSEYEHACEDADYSALATVPGAKRRAPSEWTPAERVARRIARAQGSVHAVRRSAENAARMAAGAYEAHNTEPWKLTRDARRCLVGAITQVRIARRSAELAEEKLAEVYGSLDDVEGTP